MIHPHPIYLLDLMRQMVENNLEIAEAEKKSCENLAKDLEGRLADQEMELKKLMVELETERKASAAAATASSSEPREVEMPDRCFYSGFRMLFTNFTFR